MRTRGGRAADSRRIAETRDGRVPGDRCETRPTGEPRNVRRVSLISSADARASTTHVPPLLWDDTSLYVGYWVEEPFVEATLTERDAPIYKNNDVELFIAGRDAYYEVEINAFGTIYEVFFIWEESSSRAATRVGRSSIARVRA
jgi:hypothetical protein